jgi:hypothetical protein
MKTLLDQKHFGRVSHFAYQFGTNGGWAPLAGYKSDAGGQAPGYSHSAAISWIGCSGSGYPRRDISLDDGRRAPGGCVTSFSLRMGTCDLRAWPAGRSRTELEWALVLPEVENADIILLPKENQHVQYALKTRDQYSSRDREPFLAQISDFVSACKNGGGFGCDFNQGVASMRLIEDLYSRRQPLMQDWYSSIDSGESR